MFMMPVFIFVIYGKKNEVAERSIASVANRSTCETLFHRFIFEEDVELKELGMRLKKLVMKNSDLDEIWREKVFKNIGRHFHEIQSMKVERNRESKILMAIGNIGSGKSTAANEYIDDKFIIISRDEISRSFKLGHHGNTYDRRFYDLYQYVEHRLLEMSLRRGQDVFLDHNYIKRAGRKKVLDICKRYTDNITAMDFGPGMQEALNRRLTKATKGIDKEHWKKIYYSMYESYDKPLRSEGFSTIIKK